MTRRWLLFTDTVCPNPLPLIDTFTLEISHRLVFMACVTIPSNCHIGYRACLVYLDKAGMDQPEIRFQQGKTGFFLFCEGRMKLKHLCDS